MAIYHFSAKIISRSAGRNAVAAAAYRSASLLIDERSGQARDFLRKEHVVHSEILLPDGAPPRLGDRERLWNEVEACERRKDSQLSREVEFALPRELTRLQAVELARQFVTEQFVSRGMIADLNVHWPVGPDGEARPHAHVMLTMREVGRDGFGAKARAWDAVAELRRWREAWAAIANERLAEHGHDVRLDHRSLKAQGIDLEPQTKIGAGACGREARGEAAERVAEHRAIARRNGERIAQEPAIALDALTQQQSTFTRADLARFLHRHSDGAEQFIGLMAKVESAPGLVRVGTDTKGRVRYSTRGMIEVEARLARSADNLARALDHPVDRGHLEAALVDRPLGAEQLAALWHVTGPNDLALVVGYAGSGKTAMLGVAGKAWESQGYRVRGATLSGIAAENLEAATGISSRTIASLEHGWAQEYECLTSRDVLVIDEAGLIGSRQLGRVIGHARDAGAKVVLVGDPGQLQAIEAGAVFRALADRHGAVEITEVRRQRLAWQREATIELATERTPQALARYIEAGMVVAHDTREAARQAVVDRWDASCRATPGETAVILAYTRDDVQALNGLARERRRAAGELGPGVTVMTERGERSFAAGDRVMFLRNERSLGVKNGTLGQVERVSEKGLAVRLDDGARVAFAFRDYAHVDHGYAMTLHKAQGVTVDRAVVLATDHLDRHATYVGLTRHRDSVELHYGRDDFGSRAQLIRQLSRDRAKDTTLDYAPDFAEQRGLVPAPAIEGQAPASEPRAGRFAGLRLERATDAPGERFEGLRLARMRLVRAPPRREIIKDVPVREPRAVDRHVAVERSPSRGDELER